MIRIDKGIPIPAKRTPNPAKYPWAFMQVGDSILLPGIAQAGRRSACEFAKHHPRTFTARKIGRHTRIWRTA